MKIEIKNYEDLRTILEVGTHKVFFGSNEAHLGNAIVKQPAFVLDDDPSRIGYKKIFIDTEKEFLIIEKGEKAMAWNLTLCHVRDNFHTMKATFYVEVETPNEKAARRRNQLQHEYVNASTTEEKNRILKSMIQVNRMYSPKSTSCLYNEAKGIFAETNNI